MKRVLFLMSDTGGGHRAAAEAIRDALYIRYGKDQVQGQLVDVFKDYCYFPLNYQPELYPVLVKRGKSMWGMTYNLSNTHRRAAVVSQSMYLTNARKLRRITQHNADVVVSVHSVITRPSMRAFLSRKTRPPFLSVVTDLVSTHMLWYDKHAERCLVPTEAALKRGLDCGLSHKQLRITGLPVHPRFTEALTTRDEARAELGWDPELPTILMVAGGEGMGNMYETARAINARHLRCQLVIVAGKNKTLKAKLEHDNWNQPTLIYPFVKNMPTFMAAADIFVTKAGPASISEACIAGLPMIISDAIPGQETGNVDYVVENNAGVYADKPLLVADTVTSWLAEGPEGLRRRSQNALNIARPNAVWDIADEVWKWAHHARIKNPPTTPKLLRDLKVRTRQIVSSI